MRAGRIGALPVDQMFRSGRGELCSTFCYLQLVFASGIGMWFFGETLELHVAVGAVIVVSAGLFTLWRAQRQA